MRNYECDRCRKSSPCEDAVRRQTLHSTLVGTDVRWWAVKDVDLCASCAKALEDLLNQVEAEFLASFPKDP